MDYSQFLHMPEEASLLAVILILFLADLFMCKEPKEGETISQKSSAINYVAIGLLSIHTLINLLPCCNGSMQATEAFGGMYQHTPMMTVIKSVLNIGTLVVFLMANSWLRRPENIVKQGEFYLVTLFTLLGMYFMISSAMRVQKRVPSSFCWHSSPAHFLFMVFRSSMVPLVRSTIAAWVLSSLVIRSSALLV